jgi:hypothetical protein
LALGLLGLIANGEADAAGMGALAYNAVSVWAALSLSVPPLLRAIVDVATVGASY